MCPYRNTGQTYQSRAEQSRAQPKPSSAHSRQTPISQTQPDSRIHSLTHTNSTPHRLSTRRCSSLRTQCHHLHHKSNNLSYIVERLSAQLHALATMMASSDAVEAAAYASKYRKYERDYLRRINHLYFSSTGPDNGDLFDSVATIDDFEIKESKEAPLKKFLQTSGLINTELSTSKVEPMDIDINLPSTSNKKSQRATPDGNRKSSARGK